MKYLRTLFVQDSHYFNHIEGLRGLAGLLVIWFHLSHIIQLYMPPATYKVLIQNKWLGAGSAITVCLDIFFLISGFLISLSLMHQFKKHGAIQWQRFITKRFARLYPTYIFVLIFAFPLAFNTAPYMWANLLQINNYLAIENQYLAWTWSLAVEVQFYIIIALALFVIPNWQNQKWLFYLLISLIFVPILLTLYASLNSGYIYLTLNTYSNGTPTHTWLHNVTFTKLSHRMSPIAVGVLLCYLHVFHHDRISQKVNQYSALTLNILTAALLLGIALTLYFDPWWSVVAGQQGWNTTVVWMTAMRVWFSICLGGLLLLTTTADATIITVWKKILSSKIWRPFGQLAFTSFLIHPLVLQCVFGLFWVQHQAFHIADLPMLAFKVYAWTYALSAIIYLKIEQPLMTYFTRNLTKPMISVTHINENTSSSS